MLERLDAIIRKDAAGRDARERFFFDYLTRYTNAATLITPEFKDTEADDLAGLFAGFDAENRGYDVRKWRYDNGEQGDSSRTMKPATCVPRDSPSSADVP